MKKVYVLPAIIFLVFSLVSFQGILKTSLEITIRSTIGNTLSGVEVNLYKNYEDFQNGENAVADSLITDKNGKVLFKGLESIPYYVSAVKGDDNNFGDGEMVNALIANKKNKVTIIIR